MILTIPHRTRFARCSRSFVDLTPEVADVKLLHDSTTRTCTYNDLTTKFALSQPNTYYKFDPRVIRPENTIDSPAQVIATGGDACFLTKKNLFNAHTCITDTTSCLMPSSDTQIILDATNIKKFYELGDRHVHYVQGRVRVIYQLLNHF